MGVQSDTKIEFTIRDDITFHDGTPLTPEDIVFSVKRITDPDFASPQLGQFNKIIEAEATGPHTVVLTTDGPYPALLAQLVKLSIVPKHVVERVGNDEFNLHPVGSGPYKFDEWQRGVSVTLARNDDYWGTKGPFETAVFRVVPDAATRMADLQAGAADLVIALNSDLAAQLEGSPNAKRLSALDGAPSLSTPQPLQATVRQSGCPPRRRLFDRQARDRGGHSGRRRQGHRPDADTRAFRLVGWYRGIALRSGEGEGAARVGR